MSHQTHCWFALNRTHLSLSKMNLMRSMRSYVLIRRLWMSILQSSSSILFDMPSHVWGLLIGLVYHSYSQQVLSGFPDWNHREKVTYSSLGEWLGARADDMSVFWITRHLHRSTGTMMDVKRTQCAGTCHWPNESQPLPSDATPLPVP